MADKKVFDELYAIDLTGKTEGKKTGKKDKNGKEEELTYLSWSWAWAEIKRRYPDAHYEIERFNDLPYVYDEKTGYMVFTKVTIDGVTHEMWLPVMDSANKAMKAEPYEYVTGYGQYQKTKTCSAASMFDVNKTIMRCLVKNLAMFGLGLYIYAGEDLPEDADEVIEKKPTKKAEKVEKKPIEKTDEQKNEEMKASVNPLLLPDGKGMTQERLDFLHKEMARTGINETTLLGFAKCEKFEDMDEKTYIAMMNKLGRTATKA